MMEVTFSKNEAVLPTVNEAPEVILISDQSNNPDQINRCKKFGAKFAKMLLLLPLPLAITSDLRSPDIFTINSPEALVLETSSVSVMTANVHGWETTGGSDSFDTFMQSIEHQQPEVVCVQEMIADRDKVSALADEGYNMIFATTTRQGLDRRRGNAILSKGRILLDTVIELPNTSTSEPRNAITASVQTSQGFLKIAGTHLSTDLGESTAQSKKLNTALYGTQILCGDFNQGSARVNSGPFGNRGGAGKSSARGSRFTSSTPGVPTFPNVFPIRAIDHIFSCSEPDGVRTVGIGSDHRALMATYDVSRCIFAD